MATTARIDGQKLRAARLKAGMTQAQLARRIRTTERNIARWESSQNQPRVESVAAIAVATGQGIEFFLTTAEEEEDEEDDLLPSLDDLLRRRVSQLIREAQAEVA